MILPLGIIVSLLGLTLSTIGMYTYREDGEAGTWFLCFVTFWCHVTLLLYFFLS